MEPPRAAARPNRWVGVPGDERVRDRRSRLIAAAYELFGTEGDAATSVRAVCRAADLNPRYFYESFVDRDELLGAVYDHVAADLAERLLVALAGAGPDPAARTRAGIRTVLRTITDDPRRARVLFTEGRANPVLADRRREALQALVDETAAAGRAELGTADGATDDEGAAESASAMDVAAAMFGGAMEELAQSWIDGRLGTDLDAVVDRAVELAVALFERAAG